MFKVGDKVRVTEYSDKSYIGLQGVITEISDGPYPISVNLGNVGNHAISPQQLTNDDKPSESEQDTGLIDKQEHYTANGIQPIEIMKANLSTEEYHGFLISNVWKYTFRYKRKNGLEDLKKAQTYLTWLISEVEELGDDIYWKK